MKVDRDRWIDRSGNPVEISCWLNGPPDPSSSVSLKSRISENSTLQSSDDYSWAEDVILKMETRGYGLRAAARSLGLDPSMVKDTFKRAAKIYFNRGTESSISEDLRDLMVRFFLGVRDAPSVFGEKVQDTLAVSATSPRITERTEWEYVRVKDDDSDRTRFVRAPVRHIETVAPADWRAALAVLDRVKSSESSSSVNLEEYYQMFSNELKSMLLKEIRRIDEGLDDRS